MSAHDQVLRLVARGQVQGVFFRDSCRQEAARLGIRGWVRNRDDGAVEAVVAGPERAVRELVRWARQGPPRASVEALETEPAEDPGTTGFEVR